MKRKNPLMNSLYLFGTAAALILLVVFVLKPQFQKQKEEKEKSSLLFLNAQRDKILEIAVKSETSSFTLKKSGESKDWILESQKSFDADSSAVDSMISSLLGTKKEENLTIELGKAGLDVPPFELKLTYTDEENKKVEKTLLVGQDSPVDYQSYAKWKESPEVFMISKSLKFAIDKKIADLRNKRVLDVKLADLKEISVSGPSTYKLELGEGGKWWILLKGRKLAADTSAISDWMNGLSNTRVANFAADEKSKLAPFGLARPAASLKLLDLKGNKREWQIGNIKVGKENKSFLITQDKESIFEMPLSFWDEVKKDSSEFRSKQLAQADREKIARITYESPNLKMEFSKNDSSWTASHTWKGSRNEGPVKAPHMELILNSLARIQAVSFLDKSPKSASLGLGSRKVAVFESEATPKIYFEVGNSLKQGETVIYGETFEDPAIVSLDFAKLFPEDMSKIIDVKSSPASTNDNLGSDKSAPPATSSSPNRKRKIMKLEKTANSPKELKKLAAPIVEKGAKYFAQINFKNGRRLKIDLAADKAPYTVSNFIHLARNGFYDGVTFHRVIANFVAQGGDPTGTGTGGPGWKFDNEENDLKHLRGSLSMAHAGPGTNGSQFFVVLAPQPHLDGKHTVFGQVTEGIDDLDAIKQGDAMATVEIFQEY